MILHWIWDTFIRIYIRLMNDKILDAEDQLPLKEGRNTRVAFRMFLYSLIAATGIVYITLTYQEGYHDYQSFERNRMLLSLLHWGSLILAIFSILKAGRFQEPKLSRYQITLFGIPLIIIANIVVLLAFL